MSVRHRFNLRVPMRDGVTLAADVTMPDDDDRHPCILHRTPYNKNTERAARWATRYAEAGYAFAWMDVRGRGDSDGEFDPYRADGHDGHDAIEWLAAQPWCTGDVGTVGGSYTGMNQYLAALERPPHLRAMVVGVTPSDPFVSIPTGTPGPMYVCWERMVDGHVMQHVQDVDWMRVYRHLPLLTMDERAGFRSEHWRRQLAHPLLDDYWEPLRYQGRLGEIDLPVLHLTGWYDDELVTPSNFAAMTAPDHPARERQRLVVGPWPHTIYRHERQLGDVDFGPEAMVDLHGVEIRWFDRWIRGIEDAGPREDAQPSAGGGPSADGEAPVRIFVMGTNRWRDEREWPLARTEWRSYHLSSGGSANSRFGDGSLILEPPSDREPADVYLSDPSHPVPFLTNELSNQIGGPDDYGAVEQRSDVLCYTTPPLEADLEVTGPVSLVLYASSSAVDTDLMAKLVDVHPGGFCQRLCDGMVRARYREGMDREAFLEPGRVERFEIRMWDTSQVFRAGHRIRLEVASSAFPKFDRNAQTGGPLATETGCVVAENRVWHDAERPSHLVLPVIPS
jgi:uncharacterized protein